MARPCIRPRQPSTCSIDRKSSPPPRMARSDAHPSDSGHYDILYKGSDVQVNYALAMPTYAGLQATPMPVAQAGTDLSFLTEIPGMSFLPGAQPNYLGGVPVSVPLASAETQSVDYADPVIGSVPAAFPTPTAPTSPSASSVGGSSFRPSRYSCEYEAGLHRSSTQTQHYQTPSFKKYVHVLASIWRAQAWFLTRGAKQRF